MIDDGPTSTFILAGGAPTIARSLTEVRLLATSSLVR